VTGIDCAAAAVDENAATARRTSKRIA